MKTQQKKNCNNSDEMTQHGIELREQEVLITQLEEEIFWMKSSKFWKSRRNYLRSKKKIEFFIFTPNKFLKKYIKVIQEYFVDNKSQSLKIEKQYVEEKEKFDKRLFSGDVPRVIAIVNHYYNKNSEFRGKSSRQDKDIRRRIVERVINELNTIPNIDILVCGIEGYSLVKIDRDFSSIEKPVFLVYESIEWMFSQIDKYDYFINIEDDILFTRETFERIVDFDQNNTINECLHPNRMEYECGIEYCADFKAKSGWKKIVKKYKKYNLRVAKNPHSGLTVLSKPKMLYACDRLNLKRRDIIIGHYMASAYANVNSPFLLYRSFPKLSEHKVIHLDNWEER